MVNTSSLAHCDAVWRGVHLSTDDQVAVRVGYQDESAFRRLFKKHVGVSPREYRQRVAAR
jgi:AraC-like DNA-binding protein